MNKSQAEILLQINQVSNAYLRHYIKKSNLKEKEALFLGHLLELTEQRKTAIKISYTALAAQTHFSKMDLYHMVQDFHRYGILAYEHDGDFLKVSFYPIEERIDEIEMAYRNERRIKVLEQDVSGLKNRNYIYEHDLYGQMYAIIGDIISQKIGEALRSLVYYINQRLDQVSNLNLWKYRYRYWKTGIPVAEWLLRDSLPFLIDEIFLVEKKSALLLAHSSRHKDEMLDRDLVAGMLSAINDFVRSAFQQSNQEGHINEITYSDVRIVIREAPFFFCGSRSARFV